MKTPCILFIFLLISCHVNAQKNTDTLQLKKQPRVFLAAGAHLGFWAKDGQDGVPFNVQADVLLSKKFVLGLGYTYDAYLGDPSFFSARTRPGYRRQNVNVRVYRYFNDPSRIFSAYIGFSGGVSLWQVKFDGPNVYPSSQFLFGLKLRIFKGLFWQTEFGAGPPFMCQSSLGYAF